MGLSGRWFVAGTNLFNLGIAKICKLEGRHSASLRNDGLTLEFCNSKTKSGAVCHPSDAARIPYVQALPTTSARPGGLRQV